MKDPVINNNSAIEIHQVQNGFLVKAPSNFGRDEYPTVNSSYVFQSFQELADWLSTHFSFRCEAILPDAYGAK